MTDQQTPQSNNTQNIAQAIQEVSDRAQMLVREEIELAKAEVSAKVSKLIKGVVVGVAGGIFVVCGLLFVLHGFAWLAYYELVSAGQIFCGFFFVAGVLFLLVALAGFIAARAMKSGSPPVPKMAIDEAKRIRETVTSKTPEQTV